jgi:hypothetical protein
MSKKYDLEVGDKVSARKFVYDTWYSITGTVVEVSYDHTFHSWGAKIADDDNSDWYDLEENSSTTDTIEIIQRGGVPATQKQLDYLIRLNAWHESTITKRQASDLIDEAKTRVVDPALYYVKPINAICELCGTQRPVEEMADGSGGYDWDNPDEDFQGSIGLLSYRCSDGTGCRANRSTNAEIARVLADSDHYGRYDDNSPGQIGGGG